MTLCDLGDGCPDGGLEASGSGGEGPGTKTSSSQGGSTGFEGPMGCRLIGAAVTFGV